MSVVNKMLQDLEQRQSDTGGADYVAPNKSYARYYYVLVVIVALCVLAYWAKQVTNVGQTISTAQSTSAAPSPVAAPRKSAMPIVNQKLDLNPVKMINAANQEMPSSQAEPTTSLASDNSIVETTAVVPAQPAVSQQPLVTEPQALIPATREHAIREQQADVSDVPVVLDPVSNDSPPSQPPSYFSVVPSSAHGGEAVTWRNKAQRALNNKRYSDAAFALQKMLEIQPEDFLAVQQLAKVHVKLNDVVSAMDVLGKGIETTNNAHSLRLMLAQLYVSEDARAEALEVLKGFQPDIAFNTDYYALQGALAQALEDYDVAYASYYKLSLFAPKQGKWWLGLAAALDSQGESQDSKQAYQRALRLGRFSQGTETFILQRISALGS